MMHRSPEQLRTDALRIWRAGVEAVRSQPLMFQAVEVDADTLRIGEELLRLSTIERIAVVGGGKAAAGMAAALEQALGPVILRSKQVIGWVNVPEDCLLETDCIHLHPARPPGVNEPTTAAVEGVQQMRRLLSQLGPRDLCLALISGGGSALLPAPIEGFSLEDKIELTRALSAQGATIEQMNAVRRELSDVKGGRLAQACRAGRMISLIISDVPGDELSLVASGPTVPHTPSPEVAIGILQDLKLDGQPAAVRAIDLLRRPAPALGHGERGAGACQVKNILLGNNAAAVDAAGVEAERLGYSHAMLSANAPEGLAEDVAHGLVEMARRMRDQSGPDCLISGGEPTVRLAPADCRGRGGRNQQLCLAALASLDDWRSLALISGGTDGEDGPTVAAGACVDENVAAESRRLRLDPREFLARNDAYTFFEQTGGLLMTGPTHTNVCDLRVITVSR